MDVVIIQIMFIVYFEAKDIDDKNDVMEFTYSTKFWWDKTLADLELQENWWRKFWWFVMLIIVHYKNLQHLADKLWQIADCPPKFCAVQYYMPTTLAFQQPPGVSITFTEYTRCSTNKEICSIHVRM